MVRVRTFRRRMLWTLLLLLVTLEAFKKVKESGGA